MAVCVESGSVVDASFTGEFHPCRSGSYLAIFSETSLFSYTMCTFSYPDITFDEHSANFLCPACTNTCNCSFCSRSRGEEFVSMRVSGLAASISKSKVTLVRDVGQPLHRPKSPDTTTQRDANGAGLSTQSQFWAHVYGLEGERVGSAFMTGEHVGCLTVTPSSSMPSHPKAPSQSLKKAQTPMRREKKRDKSRGSRVLIEEPPASWKVSAVRDSEPSADADLAVNKGKGKERRRGGRKYIRSVPRTASLTPLSIPSRCSTPVICSDGSLTPLSDLEVDSNWL